MKSAAAIGVSMLFVVGCHSAVKTVESPPSAADTKVQEVTLYLPGMNRQLAIL